MNENAPFTEDLRVMLQCCHSILGTAWPRPGYPSLAGAGRLIHTKLFSALQNADKQLCQLFAKTEQPFKEYANVWENCHRIISALKRLEKNCLHPSIDSAFNLLYLTTGVLYHKVVEGFSTPPVQDKRFASVEDLKELLSKCQWQSDAGAGLIQPLNKELADTLEELTTPCNIERG